MTHFRVVVVDDEPLARDMTVALLERDPEVTVVGRCGDSDEARAVMRRERPQIVFLDIEMPGTDGLELVRGLSPAPPAFVFVTAFSEYATEAFDVQALDYVLKPFSDERLYEALARAKRRVRERALSETGAVSATGQTEIAWRDEDGSGSYLQRLPVKEGHRSLVLKVDDVHWIKAEDYYVLIHSTRGRHLLRATMASLEARLDPAHFLRIHRVALVNVEAVEEVQQVAKGVSRVVLADGTRLPVSRSRKTQVMEVLLPRLRGA